MAANMIFFALKLKPAAVYPIHAHILTAQFTHNPCGKALPFYPKGKSCSAQHKEPSVSNKSASKCSRFTVSRLLSARSFRAHSCKNRNPFFGERCVFSLFFGCKKREQKKHLKSRHRSRTKGSGTHLIPAPHLLRGGAPLS